MQRLIVNNFGPLKYIDIQLKDVNIIIGQNGEGKSILGKLITIVNGFYTENQFIQRLKDYNLYELLKDDTEISFWVKEELFYSLKNKKIENSKYDSKKTKTSYIPAERNLISLFSQHIATLVTPGLPTPRYSLKDGKAKLITDENGLINENKIDLVSEEMAEEFDQLVNIYRDFKND